MRLGATFAALHCCVEWGKGQQEQLQLTRVQCTGVQAGNSRPINPRRDMQVSVLRRWHLQMLVLWFQWLEPCFALLAPLARWGWPPMALLLGCRPGLPAANAACWRNSGCPSAAARPATATNQPLQVGFVDSFNISVAAALIMYEARRCREQHLG